jgi:hypothetical protein
MRENIFSLFYLFLNIFLNSFLFKYLKNTFEMNKPSISLTYQGVRMNYTKERLPLLLGHIIHYPGVRSKGSTSKVVRKVSNQGKVYPVFSWTADISEERLATELQLKNK